MSLDGAAGDVVGVELVVALDSTGFEGTDAVGDMAVVSKGACGGEDKTEGAPRLPCFP